MTLLEYVNLRIKGEEFMRELNEGNNFGFEPMRIDSVKIVKVIEVRAARGHGTEADPTRVITQHWTMDGEILAENDPVKNELGPHGELWTNDCGTYQFTEESGE